MVLRYKQDNALLHYRPTDVEESQPTLEKHVRCLKKPACYLDISENKMLEKASGDPTWFVEDVSLRNQ